MNLRFENERFQNDIKFERKINERMMKYQEDVNQLNEKNIYRKKGKQELNTKKKVNLQNKELKGIKDPLAIVVVRQGIHRTNLGAMEKENSMENATIGIIMVIWLMSAKRNQNLKANITNARNMDTSHYNEK